MSWVRLGDESGMHEVVMAPLNWEEAPLDRAWVLFGVMTRAVTFVAMHKGDYILTRAKFMQAAMPVPYWDELWGQAVRAGYGHEVKLEDGTRALKLVEDKTLYHMISREAKEANNQHRNDTRKADVRARVKLRDGDNCRWCGKVVEFNDHRSSRAGTYSAVSDLPPEHLDHLHGKDPKGKPAKPDMIVVSCGPCNQSRQDDREGWTKQLLSVPDKPFYSVDTAAYIKRHLNIDVEPSEHRTKYTLTEAPPVVTPPDSAPSSEVEHTGVEPHGQVSSSTARTESEAPTEPVMPGRDGTGLEGKGLDGGATPPPPQVHRHENPPTDSPRPGDHKPGKRKRPRRRKKK